MTPTARLNTTKKLFWRLLLEYHASYFERGSEMPLFCTKGGFYFMARTGKEIASKICHIINKIDSMH